MFFLDVDPSVVKPGWTPLIITILLAAAIALLMISMRRQIRKISVPHRDEVDDSAADTPGGEGSGKLSGGASASEPDSTSPSPSAGPSGTLGGTAGERHPIVPG